MEQELKNCWRNCRFNINGGNGNRRMTALQQMIERYNRFSRVAFLMVLFSPAYFFLLLRNNTTASLGQTMAMAAFLIIYFLLAGAMDRWLAHGLSAINLAEMSVAEVCRRAFFYRKRHFQFMAVLIPMCLILLGWLVWLFSGNDFFLYGLATGAVIGAAVGVTALRRFLREYRDLTSD